MSTSTPYPLSPGQPPQPITDGGNSPVGAVLVNRGDNGGTIWVQAGPTGSAGALPLGPSASLQWTDRLAVPHAYLAPGSTADEVLILTDQSAGYSNPAAVAAATAVQLAGRGIPNVFTNATVGDFRLFSGSSTADPLPVAGFGSLVVGVSWPQPTPTGPTAVRLTFTDPLVPQLPAVNLYLTNNNAVDPGECTWQIPILGPALSITNISNTTSADAYVSVTGNNRTVDRLRLVGEELGARQFNGSVTAGVNTILPPVRGRATSRFNGQVTAVLNATQAGVLYLNYVDESGTATSAGFTNATGRTVITTGHPSVPSYWSWNPAANGGCNLTLFQT